MKKVLGFIVVVAVLFVGAMMLSAQNQGNNQIDNGPKYWGGPQYYFNTLNIPAGDLYVGGAVVTSTAYTGVVQQAAITNALITAGPYIGGNISKSTVTNLLTASFTGVSGVYTNITTSSTNVMYFSMGILTNVTRLP